MSIQSIIKNKTVGHLLILASGIWLTTTTASEANSSESPDDGDSNEVVIWGKSEESKKTNTSSPTSVLVPEDLISVNATTTEDLLAHEPGLIIRKRYIGDSNGTIGIRGSNMFQTTRSMVFADGVPLHYFLQTRYSGAPRWTLVSADEIAQIDVVYGPFSAEYSGNAMGGVVNIETAIPTERKVHLQTSFFRQDFEYLGYKESLNGSKQFLSYADSFDDFTLYFSYNHLKNDGHPQTFRFARLDATDEADGDETTVTGGLLDLDEYGDPALYFGNTGVSESDTNNYKIKLGYDFGQWSSLLNIAYEDRTNTTQAANNYLTDTNGDAIWSGDFIQDGHLFRVRESNFSESELDRRSLLIGFRLIGELNENWTLEGDFSNFEVLEDQTRSSNASRLSPQYTLDGRIREYDNTGWSTYQLKLKNDQFFGKEFLGFSAGVSREQYDLEINNYDSTNYLAGDKTALRNNGNSGGSTSLSAIYAQLDWDLNRHWNTVVGLRQEKWKSNDGFYGSQLHIDREESRFSPKFSLSYQSDSAWRMQYSLAKAFRFPIVEELFQNERRTTGTSLANANLEPEDGVHQNLMWQYNLDKGYLRANYFAETIEDVIVSQRTIVDNISVSTFIPIDKVETQGIELIYNQLGLLGDRLDLRYNMTYLDSEIVRNSANIDIEGKTPPRMPHWRANLMATFHLNSDWNIGTSLRYASNSFGDLDSADIASNVFGSQDKYFFVNLKANYQVNENTKISAGVDNVFDELAFVHHPWPQRTYFLDLSFTL